MAYGLEASSCDPLTLKTGPRFLWKTKYAYIVKQHVHVKFEAVLWKLKPKILLYIKA